MIPAQSLLAKDFTSTETAEEGKTLTLNPGDTVTTSSGPGIVATGIGSRLNAPDVEVSTTGEFGFGALADRGGTISITMESTNHCRADELTAPVNIFVSQPVRIGKLPTATPRPIPRARVAF
jgi:hypothetical protein